MSYLKNNPDILKTVENQLYEIIFPSEKNLVDKKKETKKEVKTHKKVEENVRI